MPLLTPRVRVGLVLLSAPLVLPGAARAAAVTRTFSTRGETVFTVPAGVTSVAITATGERGLPAEPGGVGGTAARVFGTLAVSTGEKLYLEVGVGGGKAGKGALKSGDGGGASTVQICPAAGGFCPQVPTLSDPLFSRLLIAGGGGGAGAGVAGSFYGTSGGDASLVGGSGAPGQDGGTGTGGGGATASAGGAGGVGSVSTGGVGQRGVGGDGGALNYSGFSIGGAGGGGGLFGGGGSAPLSNLDTPPAPGGGGGTSYVRLTDLPDASVATTLGGGGFSVYATDTSAPSIQLAYTDPISPQPTLTTPAGNQQVGPRPTFTGTASTGIGDKAVVKVLVRPSGSLGETFTVDDVPVDGAGTWSLTWPTALASGRWEAVVTQADEAGNTGEALPRAFTVDAVPPVIDISSPTDGAEVTVGTALTLTYACADAGVGIATCAGAVPSGTALDTSTVGERTETITATDLVGNRATRSVRYVVTPAPVTAGAGVAAAAGGSPVVPAAPTRIAPRLAVTKVRIGKARRGCSARRARLAATGRMRACRVKVTVQGTIDPHAAGQRLTISATRRRARTVLGSTVLRSGRWKVGLTLPATTGRWKLAASVPGSATLLPATARRALSVSARR